MVWLEYERSNGYVYKIHETEPTIIPQGSAVAKSEDFTVGDEFTYFITVLEVDEEGFATKHAEIQQSAPAQEILRNLSDKEQRIADLETAIAALLGGAM